MDGKKRWNSKIIFRDKPTDFLMIVGFVIIFFTIINGTYMIQQLRSEATDNSTYRYSVSMSILNHVTEDNPEMKHSSVNLSDLIQTLSETSVGNVTMKINAGVGNSLEKYPIELVLTEPEEVNLKFKDFDSDNAVLLLGKNIAKYTEGIEGKSKLSILGMALNVDGELSADSTSEMAWTSIIFWKNLSKEQQDEMITVLQPIYTSTVDGIRIEGNHDVSQSCRTLTAQFKKKYSMDLVVVNAQKQEDVSIFIFLYDNYDTIFSIFGVLFAMVNCFVILHLWMYCRQQEWMIRRVFGYSIGRIVLHVLTELGKLALIALCITTIVQSIYQKWNHLSGVWSFRGTNVLYILAGCFGILFLLVLWTGITLLKLSPAKQFSLKY